MKKYTLILSVLIITSAFHVFALPADSIPVGGWLATCENSGETNVIVRTAIPGELLDNSGILPEDIITWCDSTKLSTVTNNVKDWLKKYLSEINTGQNITLIVQRADIQLTVTVQRVSSRPLKFLPDIAGAWPTNVQCAFSLLSNDTALVAAAVINGLVHSCQIRQDAWHSELIDHVMQFPDDLHACASARAEEYINAARATNFPALYISRGKGRRGTRHTRVARRPSMLNRTV